MARSKVAWVKNGRGKNGLGQKWPGQKWPGQKRPGQKWLGSKMAIYHNYTSGWGKSQPPLFTPEKLDMFDPIYCFQQVFWLNTRPSTKRYKQFLYFL